MRHTNGIGLLFLLPLVILAACRGEQMSPQPQDLPDLNALTKPYTTVETTRVRTGPGPQFRAIGEIPANATTVTANSFASKSCSVRVERPTKIRPSTGMPVPSAQARSARAFTPGVTGSSPMPAASEAVSVAVVAHNASRDLPACLARIRAQTHGPVEILVIDNGSTDDTAAVARATPGVRVAPNVYVYPQVYTAPRYYPAYPYAYGYPTGWYGSYSYNPGSFYYSYSPRWGANYYYTNPSFSYWYWRR